MHLIERQLQNAVNNLVAWCDNGHAISPEKSRCVRFCRKRNLHLDPVIYKRNFAIPVVNDIRFWESFSTGNSTFLPHILYLRKKCERSLNILKVLSKTSSSADQTSLLRISQAVILSRIDYGCMVYGSARLEATGYHPSLCFTDLHWSLSYLSSGEPVRYFPPTTA
ncbi:hypothetical protein AVEN_19981-1 [Araneus ventricosus]|uniref:Reverse transcriptase domain-containing protein n=1 Tax=Araneus ventricosus TaxID=182803 RepID=A0A4Y2R8I3_ARAVE|nr:hypothetical protein AVEN_19981-1 [Araneus ventricosus]